MVRLYLTAAVSLHYLPSDTERTCTNTVAVTPINVALKLHTLRSMHTHTHTSAQRSSIFKSWCSQRSVPSEQVSAHQIILCVLKFVSHQQYFHVILCSYLFFLILFYLRQNISLSFRVEVVEKSISTSIFSRFFFFFHRNLHIMG